MQDHGFSDVIGSVQNDMQSKRALLQIVNKSQQSIQQLLFQGKNQSNQQRIFAQNGVQQNLQLTQQELQQKSLQLQPQTAPSPQFQNQQRSLKQNQLKKQQQPKYQLSDTMRENVLDDFVTVRIAYDLSELECGLKNTMPNVFFTLVYSVACVSPKEYENMIVENFKIEDDNCKLIASIVIASIARKINTTPRCPDFETLKTLEPYKYLVRKNAKQCSKFKPSSARSISALLKRLTSTANITLSSSQMDYYKILNRYASTRHNLELPQDLVYITRIFVTYYCLALEFDLYSSLLALLHSDFAFEI